MARAEAPTEGAPLHVELLHSPAPRQVEVLPLVLPAGSTLAQALEASGLLQRHGLDAAALATGVWSRREGPDRVLRDGDRVEVYRPLVVDPKEARRLRYRRDGRKRPSGSPRR